MLNPVKLHDSLWSISVASMLNWSSSVPGRYANGDFIGSNNGEGESSEGMQRLGGDSEDLSSSPNFDSSTINHFSFSTNFLSRGLPEESCVSIKEKLIKQAAGKSFTIDSLLGITNAAQAIQNCILPGHHHHPSHLENSPESKWFHEKVRYENVKDSRYNPYHRKDRNQASNNSGGPVSSQSDKQVDKLSKGTRRTTKSKRVRTIFTPEQLERLEAEFERQQYMVGPERLYLASSLYLTEAQVKVWFQNRRIKWRKQHLEMQQQRLAVFRSKRSNLENEEEEFDENSDSSRSVTLPSSDSVPSSGNLPLLTSFCGTLNQQETPSSTHKDVLSDSNRSNSSSPTRHPSSSAHYDSLPFFKSHESSKPNDC